MLSDRARSYLSTLKRLTPVSTAMVERALKEEGVPCYPAWLEFHERYAGYVEPLGLDQAILGLVHERSQWIAPKRVALLPSYEAAASRFIVCAEVHPSYVYKLGDNGCFRDPTAASFEIKLERSAARVAFFARRGARAVREQADLPAMMDRLNDEASVVAEGSDETYQLLLGERCYALRNTETGQVIDCGTCD